MSGVVIAILELVARYTTKDLKNVKTSIVYGKQVLFQKN
jgi:hypothetical protein